MLNRIAWYDTEKKRCPRCGEPSNVLLHRDDGSIICGPCLHALNESIIRRHEEFQKAKRLEIHEEPTGFPWPYIIGLVAGTILIGIALFIIRQSE